jgi:hypothetical protein
MNDPVSDTEASEGDFVLRGAVKLEPKRVRDQHGLEVSAWPTRICFRDFGIKVILINQMQAGQIYICEVALSSRLLCACNGPA